MGYVVDDNTSLCSAVMRVLFLLICLVLATGCSSSRVVAPGAGSGGSANLDLIGEPVTVQLVDGQRERGRFLGLYPDSTAWLDASGARVQVPTREVAQVTRVSRRDGFWTGAAASAVATGVVVGIFAYTDYLDRYANEPCSSLCGVGEALLVSATLASAVVAAVPGGAAGAAIGSREHYVVEPDSSLVYRRALPAGAAYSATTSNGFE